MTDKKISELDPSGNLNGNEEFEHLQVGNNVRSTLTKIKDWIAANLTFTSALFTPQVTPPSYAEGKLYYDDVKKALTYFNDSSEVAVNLGQEVLFIVENQTGAQIDNGTVIAPDETTVITKADAYYKEKSRVIAVATEDIPDGTTGYATKLGQVGGLNTTAYSAGQILYLGTDGAFTDTTPTDGGYICIVGVVDVVHATEGIITVDTKTSDTTVEVTDTNGFPPDQRTATTISFVDGTRTFTIAPTGSDFHFYELGDKYEKTGSENIVIADTTGSHIIYYDSGVLSELVNPTSSQVENVILNNAIVAFIYWNSTDGEAVIVQDERHGLMQPVVHVYMHQRFGAFYLSGLALEGFTIGNGSLNSHAQFGNALGVIKDEDITHNISAVTSTSGLTYLYRTGATGVFSKGVNAGYSFPVGATPLPQYNQWTGATWQLTEVTSGNYMNLHIFTNGDINSEPFSVLGTAQYSQVSLATAGQPDELSSILGTLPLPEFVLIGSVIIQGKTSFTNTPQAAVSQNSNGENYTNWTVTELSAGASPTDHNTLSNLQLAQSTVTYGHIDNQAQTIAGPKTFSSLLTLLFGSAATENVMKRIVANSTDTNTAAVFRMLCSTNVNSAIGVEFVAKRTNADATGDHNLIIRVSNGTTLTDTLTLMHDGAIKINQTPAIGTVTHPVLYLNSSTKEIEQITQLKQTSEASNATPAPTGDARENEHYITAQAAAAAFTNPSGTAANGNNLMIRIKDDGTARALTWGTAYDAFYDTLPTTTIVGKTSYINFIYNSSSTKWEMVSYITGL